MYKYEYIPIVRIKDVSEAMEKRFGRSVCLDELFDDYYENTYMYYSLDQDKEVGQMRPEIAVVYMFMKTVMTKDFQIYNKGILIEVE